jgi:hypothetical protein
MSIGSDPASPQEFGAAEFDAAFDAGQDMGDHIDWSKAFHLQRPNQGLQLSLPAWMAARLDAEARRRDVPLEALIKMWLADRLEAGTL